MSGPPPHRFALPLALLALAPACASPANAAGTRLALTRARAAAVAPRCVPATLNPSSILPGTPLSVSPLPESLDASPETQISLLGVPAAQIAHVSATGTQTGPHPGRLLPYSQGDGASFLPDRPFRGGETVTVGGTLLRAGGSQPFGFRFTISTPDPLPAAAPSPQPVGKPGDVQRFWSQPHLQPPTLTVTTHASPLAPGYILASPYSGPGQDGPMIYEDSGAPVWVDPLPFGVEATNLEVQQYEGRPVLTWWQGRIPPQGFGEGEEVIADSSYRKRILRAGNGYHADLHDFRLTPQGTALMTVFSTIHCNLSAVRGSSDGAVTDGIFQEVDPRTGLVRREWHSLDHVALAESYLPPHANVRWPYDYFHINSLAPGKSGELLISARNTWALYRIDPSSGEVLERIGGRSSNVKMAPGTPTAFQHDATELPDGTIGIFDNGAVPAVHKQSRGLLVSIDPRTGTETLVSQFEHPNPLLAGSQGNVQWLADGDAFVGWGSEPYFSEFSPGGQLLFDAHMPAGDQSYRAYRSPWTGTPREPPAIALVPTRPGGPLNVYASWNGATLLARWRLLGGPSPRRLAPLATAPRTGFETRLETPGAEGYVAVQALSGSGAVLGTSHVIRG